GHAASGGSDDESECERGADRTAYRRAINHDDTKDTKKYWLFVLFVTSWFAGVERKTACQRSLSSSTANRRPSSSNRASCRTRITASPSRFSTLPRTAASRSSTPAAAAARARHVTSSSAKASRTSARWKTTRPTASTRPGD